MNLFFSKTKTTRHSNFDFDPYSIFKEEGTLKNAVAVEMTGKMAGVITAIFFFIQLTKSRWEKIGKELADIVDTLRKCHTPLDEETI